MKKPKENKRVPIEWTHWERIASYGYDTTNDITIYLYWKGSEEQYKDFVISATLCQAEAIEFPFVAFHYEELVKIVNSGLQVSIGSPSLLDMVIQKKKKFPGCVMENIREMKYKYHPKFKPKE